MTNQKLKSKFNERLDGNRFVLTSGDVWWCRPGLFPDGEVLDDEIVASADFLRMAYPDIGFIEALVTSVANGDHLTAADADSITSSMFYQGKWV